MHCNNVITMYQEQYLCRKVITEFEILKEGRHDDGGKEENDTPEEDIRNVGSMRAAGAAHKLPALFNTILKYEIDSSFFMLCM